MDELIKQIEDEIENIRKRAPIEIELFTVRMNERLQVLSETLERLRTCRDEPRVQEPDQHP